MSYEIVMNPPTDNPSDGPENVVCPLVGAGDGARKEGDGSGDGSKPAAMFLPLDLDRLTNLQLIDLLARLQREYKRRFPR